MLQHMEDILACLLQTRCCTVTSNQSLDRKHVSSPTSQKQQHGPISDFGACSESLTVQLCEKRRFSHSVFSDAHRHCRCCACILHAHEVRATALLVPCGGRRRLAGRGRPDGQAPCTREAANGGATRASLAQRLLKPGALTQVMH